MAGKHRNLVHVGRLSQRREIPHLHVLNHALSKWCHHRKLLCEIEFAGISNSIVSQRAFSAKKISDESEITEEWKEVSGRRTTYRSCYYRDSGLVQLPIMSTRRPRGGGFKALIFGQASLVMQELERGDSGLRSFVSVQGALVMYPIFTFGTEEQKQKWLPLLARGQKIGCFGLTEPDHGSDPAGMETRARRTNKGWVLNGTKRWITNGTISDVAIIWAKAEGDIRGFIVETKIPGFQAPEIKNKLSLRASVTSDLILDDVLVPETSLLPKSDGLRSPLMCLNQARYGIAWGAIGAATACYEWAVEYTKGRIQFDKPIAQFQLVQEKLAHMLTEITKGQLMREL